MDDLFLAIHRRRVEEGLERQTRALASDQPLWALWDYSRDPRGTALTMEFIALANHRKAVRAEIAASAERSWSEQLNGFRRPFEQHDVDAGALPPVVCTVLLSSISRFLGIEYGALGLSSGHAETVGFVEGFIRRLEGERSAGRANEPGPALTLGD